MLPGPYRLYFWGVHGIFAEVVFTSVWEFVVTGKWSLMGVSSIWSFLTYGFGTFYLAEYLHESLYKLKVPLLVRCCAYVCVAYAWEFSCGALLRFFDACPWDYTPFEYDFMGLITLEYAPLWFAAGLYFEFVIRKMKQLEAIPKWKQLTMQHNAVSEDKQD